MRPYMFDVAWSGLGLFLCFFVVSHTIPKVQGSAVDGREPWKNQKANLAPDGDAGTESPEDEGDADLFKDRLGIAGGRRDDDVEGIPKEAAAAGESVEDVVGDVNSESKNFAHREPLTPDPRSSSNVLRNTVKDAPVVRKARVREDDSQRGLLRREGNSRSAGSATDEIGSVDESQQASGPNKIFRGLKNAHTNDDGTLKATTEGSSQHGLQDQGRKDKRAGTSENAQVSVSSDGHRKNGQLPGQARQPLVDGIGRHANSNRIRTHANAISHRIAAGVAEGKRIPRIQLLRPQADVETQEDDLIANSSGGNTTATSNITYVEAATDSDDGSGTSTADAVQLIGNDDCGSCTDGCKMSDDSCNVTADEDYCISVAALWCYCGSCGHPQPACKIDGICRTQIMNQTVCTDEQGGMWCATSSPPTPKPTPKPPVAGMSGASAASAGGGGKKAEGGTNPMIFVAAGGVVFLFIGIIGCVCCRKKKPAKGAEGEKGEKGEEGEEGEGKPKKKGFFSKLKDKALEKGAALKSKITGKGKKKAEDGKKDGEEEAGGAGGGGGGAGKLQREAQLKFSFKLKNISYNDLCVAKEGQEAVHGAYYNYVIDAIITGVVAGLHAEEHPEVTKDDFEIKTAAADHSHSIFVTVTFNESKEEVIRVGTDLKRDAVAHKIQQCVATYVKALDGITGFKQDQKEPISVSEVSKPTSSEGIVIPEPKAKAKLSAKAKARGEKEKSKGELEFEMALRIQRVFRGHRIRRMYAGKRLPREKQRIVLFCEVPGAKGLRLKEQKGKGEIEKGVLFGQTELSKEMGVDPLAFDSFVEVRAIYGKDPSKNATEDMKKDKDMDFAVSAKTEPKTNKQDPDWGQTLELKDIPNSGDGFIQVVLWELDSAKSDPKKKKWAGKRAMFESTYPLRALIKGQEIQLKNQSKLPETKKKIRNVTALSPSLDTTNTELSLVFSMAELHVYTFQIEKAENLPKIDTFGTIDAFIEVRFMKENPSTMADPLSKEEEFLYTSGRTKTLPNTLNPKWKEEIKIEVPGITSWFVQFIVWGDKGKVLPPQPVAQNVIPLKDLSGTIPPHTFGGTPSKRTLKLDEIKGVALDSESKKKGSIKVEITYDIGFMK